MAVAAVGDCLGMIGGSRRLKIVVVVVAGRASSAGEMTPVPGPIAPVVPGFGVANLTDAVVHLVAVRVGIWPLLTHKHHLAQSKQCYQWQRH